MLVKRHQVVIDTNVLVAALRSKRGASHKLLLLLGSDKFQLNISVPLLFEYEDAAKREALPLGSADIEDILDYICAVANKREVFFLWRPYLSDPKDDFILELAVEAQCDFVITYNKRDFKGIEKFGIEIATPKEFLQIIGELP
jgi:putative toxin-antitoxin system toxin component, PIN family